MSHVDLLPLLLPPVSYDRAGTQISAELQAEGNVLDAVQASADKLLSAMTPFDAGDALEDWERVLGIQAELGAAYQSRLQIVLAKIRAHGGLSIPYFISLAADAGYQIEIVEPQPFRCGTSRTGDRLYIPEIIWTWVVVVRGAGFRAVLFRTGTSRVGDRLLQFGEPVIETIMQELKPAFTFVSFEYPDLVPA